MLTFQITDLAGAVLHTFTDHLGGEVIIPISDSRRAKCTVSIHDPKVVEVLALKRALKVWFHQEPVFWGPLLNPVWTAVDGQEAVEINAHDPSLYWKKAFCRYGDRVVDDGFPYDGRAIRWLHECAIPGLAALAAGTPHPAIAWGVDTSQRYRYATATTIEPGVGSRPADMGHPVAGEGLWSSVKRGQNVFAAIQNISENIVGPEWRLRPTTFFDGQPYEDWAAVRLDTADEFGTDLTLGDNPVVFHRGFGRNNLSGYVVTEDGDKVKNYVTETWPGGPSGRTDAHMAFVHDDDSWHEYGIMEDWIAARTKEPMAVLRERAKLLVALYKDPPHFVDITLAPESENGVEFPYRYGRDFEEGDVVRAICKLGYMSENHKGRVMQVTLSTDDTGVPVTSVQMVPDIDATLDTDDPGE